MTIYGACMAIYGTCMAIYGIYVAIYGTYVAIYFFSISVYFNTTYQNYKNRNTIHIPPYLQNDTPGAILKEPIPQGAIAPESPPTQGKILRKKIIKNKNTKIEKSGFCLIIIDFLFESF